MDGRMTGLVKILKPRLLPSRMMPPIPIRGTVVGVLPSRMMAKGMRRRDNRDRGQTPEEEREILQRCGHAIRAIVNIIGSARLVAPVNARNGSMRKIIVEVRFSEAVVAGMLAGAMIKLRW
jgi:hypothetical protein